MKNKKKKDRKIKFAVPFDICIEQIENGITEDGYQTYREGAKYVIVAGVRIDGELAQKIVKSYCNHLKRQGVL